MAGKKHGGGTFIWADGNSYIGDFVKNLMHGDGKYNWADGRTFDG